MWFAIIGTDVPDSLEARKGARPAHLARLQKLTDEGRMMLAGPFPAIEAEDPGPAGFTGSLIVAEFPSQPTRKRGPRPTRTWPPASTPASPSSRSARCCP